MIRYLEERDRTQFLSLCACDPVNGAYGATAWNIYGADSPVADFWICGELALCRMGETLTLIGRDGSCIPQLIEFLPFSGCTAVEGTLQLVRRLPGALDRECCVMLYDRIDSPRGSGIVENPPLEQAYNLLAQQEQVQHAPWEAFYPHHSHLVRHKLGVIAGVFREGMLAATGGVYATSGNYGVLANIATHPDYRNQGLAGDIIASLCHWCRERQLTPALVCGQELAGYYEKSGFVRHGGWGRLAVEDSRP